MGTHILLLAGSFEAQRVTAALSARDIGYEAWITEPPRGPAMMPQVPLLRRLADAQAMRAAIAAGGFTAVLDASHAFDRSVTEQAVQAARALGLPYLRLSRPPWTLEQPGWRSAADTHAAATMVGPGARVFAATGWDSLQAFADFPGAVLMLRQTRRHDRPAPFPFVELVFGDPPFDVEKETALFKAREVDLLICRNLGGEASRSKLDAATALGIEVILIDRPPAPAGIATVWRTEQALDWVGTL